MEDYYTDSKDLQGIRRNSYSSSNQEMDVGKRAPSGEGFFPWSVEEAGNYKGASTGVSDTSRE